MISDARPSSKSLVPAGPAIVLCPLRPGTGIREQPDSEEEEMSESQEEREPLTAGDKAQPDAENAGEDLCPQCNGTGRYRDEECTNCGGSGKVFVPVGTP